MLGFVIGLLIGVIGCLIVNGFWARRCHELNESWNETCLMINTQWHEECEDIINTWKDCINKRLEDGNEIEGLSGSSD